MNQIHIALVYSLWGVITFYFMVVFLTFIKNRQEFYKDPEIKRKELPKVSIIIPAFNEEKGIKATIDSLLNLDYPKELLEIIVVNDGSKDRTDEIAREYEKRGEIIYIENEKNIGKAASLNKGIERANSEFVACIDADTVVERDALKKTIGYFNDEKVGAVVVRVRVKNPKNLLERIIEIEYNLGLGFYLKLLSFLNCLYLTPGQFSVYRKKVLTEIGGFDKDNIVEDTEIAYRIQKANYKIACCLSTFASTTVPNNLRSLYYQRKRWYSGTIMTVSKHRDVFFNKQLGNFGMFFIPINYGGILLGALLFLSTIYLTFSSVLTYIENISLINFDVISLLENFLRHFSFDPLSISIFYFLGTTPFIMNMIAGYLGLKSLGEKIRENIRGFIAFLFFFIPYNILWIICFYFVVSKKKIKWRESM